MLDLNRLFGFVFHSDSIHTFSEIKQALLDTVLAFDPDDAAVTMGEFGQGSGAITGQLVNSKKLTNDADFNNMTKAVCKAIGEAEINSPKFVFIISDLFSEDMAFTIYKMVSLNETYGYTAALHFIQINPAGTDTQFVVNDFKHAKSDSKWLVVHDASHLNAEIKRIIKGNTQCSQKI